MKRTLVFGLLGMLAAASLWWATPLGLGLGGDSYYYVSGAESLADGLGFSRPVAGGGVRPITHFPPLYPAALAVPAALGQDVPEAARLLHALLFGANVAVVGLLIAEFSASLWLALSGSVIVLASPAMLSVHSWLLSEALFLCLMLGALWALAGWSRGGGMRRALAAGLLLGAASLTRYVGIALLPAALLVLLPGGTPGRRRAREAGVVLGLGLAGPLLWLLRNAWVGGSTTNRSFGFHPPTAERLMEALDTLSLWLLPSRIPVAARHGVAVVVLVVFAVAVVHALRRRPRGQPRPQADLLQVALTCALGYVVLLGLSLTFVDASTPLNDRILAPLLILGLIAALLAASTWVSKPGWGRLIVCLSTLTFVVLTVARGETAWVRLRTDGQGFASRAWQTSELVALTRQLPAGTPIYTNELDALYLLTGRQAYQVPIYWDPVRAAPRMDFEAQMAAMRRRLESEAGVLIVFHTISTQQSFLPTEAELAQGLAVVLQASDGTAYARAD